MKKLIVVLLAGFCFAQPSYVNKDLLFPVAEPAYMAGKIVLSDWCSSTRTEKVKGVVTTYRYMAWNIPAKQGTQIVAPCDGYVEYTHIGGYEGAVLVFRVDDKTTITFCHLSKYLVLDGEWVKRGQPIAYVGMSGRCSGSHVRMRIDVDGERAFFNSTTFGMKFEEFEYRKIPFDVSKTKMYGE